MKKKFSYYLLTAALLVLGCYLSYMYLGAITDSIIMTLSNGAYPIGPVTIIVAVVWALAYRYSRKNRDIFKGFFNFAKTKEALIMMLPVLLYAVISNWKNFAAPKVTLAILFSALYAGICEDITWRALPLSQLMKMEGRDEKRLLLILILPAVGFGCIHFGNIAAGSSVTYVLLQVFQTFGIGLLFGAVYLRTGDMTVLFAIHFLNDLLSFMGQTEGTIGIYDAPVFDASLVFDIVFCVFAIVYAFYLVRKSKREGIFEMWDRKWSR